MSLVSVDEKGYWVIDLVSISIDGIFHFFSLVKLVQWRSQNTPKQQLGRDPVSSFVFSFICTVQSTKSQLRPINSTEYNFGMNWSHHTKTCESLCSVLRLNSLAFICSTCWWRSCLDIVELKMFLLSIFIYKTSSLIQPSFLSNFWSQ